MIHLGDITKINGHRAPIVDVITGGSPCQDLSVAGRRAGLDGERSGLFMEQIRIVKEMRDHDRELHGGRTDVNLRPRYMVWENVPGAFSSNKGRDFQAVISEIVRIAEPQSPDVPMPQRGGWPKAGCIYDEMGRWSVAWRVHDAQFWGVPQRRKRIALVTDFGGLSAAEILFERKGLSRYPAEGGEKGKSVTRSSESCFGAAGFCTEHSAKARSIGYGDEISPTLRAETVPATVYENHSQDSRYTGPLNTAPTVSATYGMGGNNQPFVVENQTYAIRPDNTSAPPLAGEDISPTIRMGEGPNGTANIAVATDMVFESINGEVAGTLDASYYKGCGERQGVEREVVCIGNGQADQTKMSDKVGALNCMHDQQAVMVTAFDCRNLRENHQKSGTLQSKPNGGYSLNYINPIISASIVSRFMQATEDVVSTIIASDYKEPPIISGGSDLTYIVRRLTPLECERLQGFPDGWTDIGEWMDGKGKRHKDADSPRYKALGNSIALPFWQFLARRICAQYERNITMASLFDGIGGFPLVFERCGAKAVWASEIEEFPIAVTKRRFPEADCRYRKKKKEGKA